MAKMEFLKEHEQADEVSRSDFPPNFIFGVATSAYQVEGACKEGSRGPSIWDAFSHTNGKIIDGRNGDIAVDQYHRYKEDIELIAKLGFDAYRFSISWSRIFPDGLGTKVNEDGITYYNNVINALLEKGIQPYVTLYHWDLPLYLHESMGGWLNKQIVPNGLDDISRLGSGSFWTVLNCMSTLLTRCMSRTIIWPLKVNESSPRCLDYCVSNIGRRRDAEQVNTLNCS